MINPIGPKGQASQFAKSRRFSPMPEKVHSKHQWRMHSAHTSLPPSKEIASCARAAHQAYIKDSTLAGLDRMKQTLIFLKNTLKNVEIGTHQVDELFAMFDSLVAASKKNISENPLAGIKAIVLTYQHETDPVSVSLDALGAKVSKSSSTNPSSNDGRADMIVGLDAFLGPSDLVPSNTLTSWRSALQDKGVLFCLAQTDLFGNSTPLETGFIEHQLQILYSYNDHNNIAFVVARRLNQSSLNCTDGRSGQYIPTGNSLRRLRAAALV